MVTETWFAPRAGAYAVHSANETGPGMRVAQPVLYLDEIVSGLGVNGRTSNSITFRRLRCLLSGSIVPYSADVTKPLPPTTIKARIVVFQWLPNTTPGKADILTLPGGSSYVYAFYNHANREQYRVMFDRTYVLSHGPIATAYNGLSTTPPSFGMGPNPVVDFSNTFFRLHYSN
jgi:hypothetical protein